MKAKDNNEIDKQCLKKMVVKFRHKVVNVISISHQCLNSFVHSIRSIHVALISGNNFLCVMCCWDQDCLPGELCGHLRKRNAVKPFNHLYTKGSRGRQGPALLFVMLGPGRAQVSYPSRVQWCM